VRRDSDEGERKKRVPNRHPKMCKKKLLCFVVFGRSTVSSEPAFGEFRLARVFPSRLVFLFVFFDWMPVGFPRNRRSAFSTSVSATTRLGCPQVPSIRRKMTLYVDTSRVSRRNSRTERRTPRVSTVAAVAAPTSRRAHRRTSRPAPRASPARVGPFRFKRSVVTPSKQRGQDVRNRPHVHDPDADRQAGVAA
jgi:hypothetical protein